MSEDINDILVTKSDSNQKATENGCKMVSENFNNKQVHIVSKLFLYVHLACLVLIILSMFLPYFLYYRSKLTYFDFILSMIKNLGEFSDGLGLSGYIKLIGYLMPLISCIILIIIFLFRYTARISSGEKAEDFFKQYVTSIIFLFSIAVFSVTFIIIGDVEDLSTGFYLNYIIFMSLLAFNIYIKVKYRTFEIGNVSVNNNSKT